jgi:hypothetical protein
MNESLQILKNKDNTAIDPATFVVIKPLPRTVKPRRRRRGSKIIKLPEALMNLQKKAALNRKSIASNSSKMPDNGLIPRIGTPNSIGKHRMEPKIKVRGSVNAKSIKFNTSQL